MKHSDENQNNSEIIYGRNSVIEALKAGTPINKILMSETSSGSLRVIIAMAQERGIVFTKVSKDKLEELTGTKNHQGVMAYTAAAKYYDVDDILEKAESLGEAPFIIILDEIQDAHNLGAIIRSADAVGAHGVIIPKRRAASLTGVVAKSSAGAVSHVMVARVPNIPNTIDELKKKGVWIAGTDLTGDTVFYDADFKAPTGLVIGSEGNGMGRLVREKCDYVLNIPMKGAVSSLNASVAAGVVMYEVFKQRNKA
ncbi:MAG: 23S rRNA (guanosine(2251)-2'-O)-methyltransferase RlmB [Clostridia bacterium]|nr:23S rRNA (guanosine(2251)-2'-O)-methyltransferase RlmB [Clostridia bacterium]